MIRIAQFNHPENPASIYGRPGDQLFPENGGSAEIFESEVNIAPAGTGWRRIFRPIDSDMGERAARIMERAARNPHIGYSQGETRYTFGDALRLAGNDPRNIVTDCNADCSSGTAAVYNAVGAGIRPGMTTYTEKTDLMTTRRFLIIEEPLRLDPDTFMIGDILWKDGHTAIVIDTLGGSDTALSMYVSERVRMRLGPGIIYPSVGELEAGTAVIAFDPFSGPSGWTIVETLDGMRCWASLKYVKPSDPNEVLRVTGWRVNIREFARLDGDVLETARLDDLYMRDRWREDLRDDRGILWYSVICRQNPTRSGYISSLYAEVYK